MIVRLAALFPQHQQIAFVAALTPCASRYCGCCINLLNALLSFGPLFCVTQSEKACPKSMAHCSGGRSCAKESERDSITISHRVIEWIQLTSSHRHLLPVISVQIVHRTSRSDEKHLLVPQRSKSCANLHVKVRIEAGIVRDNHCRKTLAARKHPFLDHEGVVYGFKLRLLVGVEASVSKHRADHCGEGKIRVGVEVLVFSWVDPSDGLLGRFGACSCFQRGCVTVGRTTYLAETSIRSPRHSQCAPMMMRRSTPWASACRPTSISTTIDAAPYFSSVAYLPSMQLERCVPQA